MTKTGNYPHKKSKYYQTDGINLRLDSDVPPDTWTVNFTAIKSKSGMLDCSRMKSSPFWTFALFLHHPLSLPRKETRIYQ
jgi:hypothetical protein